MMHSSDEIDVCGDDSLTEAEDVTTDSTDPKTRKRKLYDLRLKVHDEIKKSDQTIFIPKYQGAIGAKRCRKNGVYGADDSESTILDLPDEMIANLVLYMKPRDIGVLMCTCKRLNRIIEENLVWRELSRSHFSMWNDHIYNSDLANCSVVTSVDPYIGKCWKRQYALNYTKAIYYQNFGGSNRARTTSLVTDTSAAYGFTKMCCSRDHIFALDYAGILHVYRSRWERDPESSEFAYKKTRWHRDFSKHVIDVATDPRYDNSHRRYVYVLSQSAGMQRRIAHLTRSVGTGTEELKGCNKYGVPFVGDKIDVFDERSCRRVFNMTFDPEMRFTSIKLSSAEAQQKTLFMLTDSGKVYSLHLFEPSLLNLGTEGIQVNLKSASKCLGEKVDAIESNVGIVAFITVSGKMHIIPQKPGDFHDLFGREKSSRLGVPVPIQHIAKVTKCSIGAKHVGFIDEYGRAFVLGSNRYGQLGTGDRMDRIAPTQVLCNKHVRALHCSLNHTLAIVEAPNTCAVYGAGCGHNGRLPGHNRGSLEFVKLDVKISWSARQIDAHKECLFVLSCLDVDERSMFAKRRYRDGGESNTAIQNLKTFQELLMDMKKTTLLSDKAKILEIMINKVASSFCLYDATSNSSIATSERTRDDDNGISMTCLKNAVHLIQHDAERLQLDFEILKKVPEETTSNS